MLIGASFILLNNNIVKYYYNLNKNSLKTVMV